MRLWLPLIQSFSSLEILYIIDDDQSVSSPEPLKLSSFTTLKILHSCVYMYRSSILEILLNLKYSRLFNYTTLEQLPELSSMKQLKILDIGRYISLQSLPHLPPHLEQLKVDE